MSVLYVSNLFYVLYCNRLCWIRLNSCIVECTFESAMNVQSPCTYGRSNDVRYVHASDLHSVTCIVRCFVNGTLNDVQVVLSLLPVYFYHEPLAIDVLSEGTFVEPGFIQSILDWLLWQPMVGPILLIGTQSVFQVPGLT